jgi:uncharacterized protein
MSLLLFVLLAGTAIVQPPAQPSLAAPLLADNDEDDDESLDAFVDETIAAVNAYWQEVFRANGQTYRAPKVVKAAYNQRIRSQCGNSRGAEHSYCGWDETVFLDWDSDSETSFEALWDDDRSFVIVTTIAHEWGHHVQQILGVYDLDTRSVEVENQADCLMGLFANTYARSSDWVSRADFRDAIEDTRDSGDDPDTPAAERTHGTPDQRVEAFLRGYRGRSLSACGL